ncbi:hypothetical protein [Haloprofundus halobius]|uniref:hypothetical protein n=1 Tax=Haloprofundus halobius TaxID=2876194 RepID=UPI001CCFADEF|nr:hypothetical protein [Haloprofundus halobius]
MGEGGPTDPTYDPAAVSHRALREIRRELERHPAVAHAQGFPPDSHARVEGRLDPSPFGVDVDSATLTVRWFAGETPDDPPEFSIHYSDERGVDFGWHHEPNPHVEGWGHYQERTDSTAEYAYEPHSFSTSVPSRVIWETLSLLQDAVSTVDH